MAHIRQIKLPDPTLEQYDTDGQAGLSIEEIKQMPPLAITWFLYSLPQKERAAVEKELEKDDPLFFQKVEQERANELLFAKFRDSLSQTVADCTKTAKKTFSYFDPKSIIRYHFKALGFSDTLLSMLMDYINQENYQAIIDIAKGFLQENPGSYYSCVSMIMNASHNGILSPDKSDLLNSLHDLLASYPHTIDGEGFRNPWIMIESLGWNLGYLLDLDFDKYPKLFDFALEHLSFKKNEEDSKAIAHELENMEGWDIPIETALFIMRTIYEYNGEDHAEDKTMQRFVGFKLWPKMPEWLLNEPVNKFADEIKALGLEPAEVFVLLKKSSPDDVPATKKEFLKALAILNRNNGIERFGRYSMKILNSVLSQKAAARHVLVLVAKSDWNNAFYNENIKDLYESIIDRGGKISLYETDDRSETRERIDSAGKQQRVDLLIFNGHGEKDKLYLGDPFLPPGLSTAVLTTSEVSDMKDLKDRFNIGAQVLLIACSTGATIDGLASTTTMELGIEAFAPKSIAGFNGCTFSEQHRLESCEFIDPKTGEHLEIAFLPH